MKSWTKNQLKRLRLYLMINSDKRNKYLRKHNIFAAMGDNVFFQPRVLPSDPKLIKFHNNVIVTSNVTFVTHDIFDIGINNIYPDRKVPTLMKPIEVMDNVFIGCNSTILGGVTIGPNVVIAAGSVVTKDVPANSVVAGNPAIVIETFDEYINKRYQQYHSLDIDDIWNHFYQNKN
jgi:acetyltransferase-like isoleucine patch superfamily enzyme